MDAYQFGGRGGMYWDCAPDPFMPTYVNTVAPHVRTTRISYTPPAGHIFRAEHAYFKILRISASAGFGQCLIWVNLSTLRHGATDILRVEMLDNTPFVPHDFGPFDFGTILDTDLLTVDTQDGSTDGAVFFALYMKGTQFERQYAALVNQF